MGLNFTKEPEAILGIFKQLRVRQNHLIFPGDQLLQRRIAEMVFPKTAYIETPGEVAKITGNDELWFGEDFSGDTATGSPPSNALWEMGGTGALIRVVKENGLWIAQLQGEDNHFADLTTNLKWELDNLNEWEIRGRFKYIDDDGNVDIRLGFNDRASFTYDGTNWRTYTDNSSVAADTQIIDMIPQDTWTDFRIRYNGTTVYYYINNEQVDSSSVDPDDERGIFFLCDGDAGSTDDHQLKIDWFTFKWK